jgi:hypothetical protein
VAEELESGTAMHLPHDPLGVGDDAFGAAVAPREGQAGVDGGTVEFQAVAEAVQVGQVCAAGLGDPLGGLGVVAAGGREQGGEVADERGELGHLGAGRGEEAEQVGVLGPQAAGVYEQEPGEVAGGCHGVVASARPWLR